MTELNASKFFADPQVAALADTLQHGDVAAAGALIERGVSVNAEGVSGFRPIFFALGAPTPAALELVLRARGDPNVRLANGDVPLFYAVQKPTGAFTAALLAAQADPNARASNDKPIIHEAILSDQPEHVRLLAHAGANLNVLWATGTPVYGAASAFAWSMVVTLIDLGARADYKDRIGRTAATFVCDVAASLLRQGRATAVLQPAYDALASAGERPPCTL